MFARGFIRGFVLPAAERLTRTRFWSYYKESLRFDRWDTPSREALRARRLSEVWNAALASKLHHQRLEEMGLPETRVNPEDARALLTRLAPVTKAVLRRHFPAGVTTGQESDDWRYLSTAGTTDRMTVVADFRKRDHRRSSELRVLHLALGADVAVRTVEIPPNACNVVCGLVDTGPPTLLGYLRQALRQGKLFSQEARTEICGRLERRMVMPLHTLPPIEPMSARQLTETLDRYLARIAAERPLHLRGFPVYLLWLADRCRDLGHASPLPTARGPQPRLGPTPTDLQAVSPFGGLASPAMATRIGAGLGCRFVNKYGTSELGAVAASCGKSPGMHLFEDLFLAEVLRRGQPVPPGEVGQLAFTDLINTAMPLIRYEVGDVGRLLTDPCPCGRRTARIEVLGRVQEVLDAPSGLLTASAVADTFFDDPAVGNFRLEEVAAGSFEAAVVARSPGALPDLSRWQDRFAALHGGVRKVRARAVPFVQPESSGKYRFVLPRPTSSEVL
jgi:phenylacetate-CoA ligase